MLRRIIVLFALAALAVTAVPATVFPDQWGEFALSSRKPLPVTETALWREYEFEEAEQAEYAAGDRRFTAKAYRFQDSTGALAAYQWLRPANGRPSKLQDLAVETADGAFLAYGNFVLEFIGRKPEPTELTVFFNRVPMLEESPLPTLAGFLPTQHLVPNSERFILGPVSLEKFEPRIPPSVAAFHLGSEGQLAKFKAGDQLLDLAIFAYPTPQLARQRVEEFAKLSGAMAKRSGPLVAVVLSPPDVNEAEKLLARVTYQANITWSENVQPEKNVGDLLIEIFTFVGILVAFAAVAGLALGGVRFVSRRWFGSTHADEPMVVLDLRDK